MSCSEMNACTMFMYHTIMCIGCCSCTPVGVPVVVVVVVVVVDAVTLRSSVRNTHCPSRPVLPGSSAMCTIAGLLLFGCR